MNGQKRGRAWWVVFLWFALVAEPGWTADPCRSGLEPGQRPGPYAAVISTGPERGKSHCYICETGDRPAVVVFARSLSDSLAKLCQQLDQAVAAHQKVELRAWMTLLSDDQMGLDPRVVQWASKHALRNVPLGIFEDVGGPPSYRLARDADVTVLLFVKQKVVANFAFRECELNAAKIAEIVNALPRIVGAKPEKSAPARGS
ncbi:MAG TPA: hypothetical protein VKU02_20700 [Gemmataceae bacterium]|nr:hypothetical protein [Gemmataceae bacterium]